MALEDSPYFLVVLVGSAFIPPLLFMAWIRNTARHGREPWRFVVKAFVWGAVFSVIVAIIFSLLLLATLGQIGSINDFLARRFNDPDMVVLFLGAVVVAPIAEEAAKGLGVRAGRPEIQGLRDGLVYGAAAGLGFSATENLLYGILELLKGGALASLFLIAIRSFSSSFLHASASAVLGYGLARSWLTRRTWAFAPWYLVAVVMHALFNLFSLLGELYSATYGDPAVLVSFLAAAGLAIIAITIVRGKLATGPRPVS